MTGGRRTRGSGGAHRSDPTGSDPTEDRERPLMQRLVRSPAGELARQERALIPLLEPCASSYRSEIA